MFPPNVYVYPVNDLLSKSLAKSESTNPSSSILVVLGSLNHNLLLVVPFSTYLVAYK